MFSFIWGDLSLNELIFLFFLDIADALFIEKLIHLIRPTEILIQLGEREQK